MKKIEKNKYMKYNSIVRLLTDRMDKLLGLFTSDKATLKKNLYDYMQNYEQIQKFAESDIKRLCIKLTEDTSEDNILITYKEICITYLGNNVNEINDDSLPIAKQLLANTQTDQKKINAIHNLSLEPLKSLVEKLYKDLQEAIKKAQVDIATLYKKAKEEIPQYFEDQGSVHLHGKYNNTKIDLIVESGTTNSFMYLTLAELLNITHMIDTSSKITYLGESGLKQTYGVIYYIELKICEGKEITIPTQIHIIDDTDKDNVMKLLNARSIILGKDFLAAHEVFLDFKNKELTLNGSIKFNYHSKNTNKLLY